ncbi:hypothetical protein CO015_04525, partial [candidate division WWE3 bacterium CG_4_8_14_3_um_filter_42_11]
MTGAVRSADSIGSVSGKTEQAGLAIQAGGATSPRACADGSVGQLSPGGGNGFGKINTGQITGKSKNLLRVAAINISSEIGTAVGHKSVVSLSRKKQTASAISPGGTVEPMSPVAGYYFASRNFEAAGVLGFDKVGNTGFGGLDCFLVYV